MEESESGSQIADLENATGVDVTPSPSLDNIEQPLATRRRGDLNPLPRSLTFQDASSRRPGSPPVKHISSDDRVETSTTPHSTGQTRDTTIPFFFKHKGPHIPEYDYSIIDNVLKRFGRSKPNAPPDDFELFLRSKGEITLAGVYRVLSDKSAWKFRGLFYFRVLHRDALGFARQDPKKLPSVPDDFKYDESLSELFHRTHTEFANAGSETVRLCCIAVTAPSVKSLFSAMELFASSAYPDPQFWSRMLCAYFLYFCRQIDRDYANAIILTSKLFLEGEYTVNPEEFSLPSRKNKTKFQSKDVFDYTWAHIQHPLVASDFPTLIHKMQPFKAVKYRKFYKHPPKFAKIRFSDQQNQDGSHNITLLFSGEQVMDKFNLTFNDMSSNLRKANGSIFLNGPTTVLHIYQIIFTISEIMNEQISDFLVDITQRAQFILLECQDSPGSRDYLYITLLEDFVLTTIRHLRLARERIESLEQNGIPESFRKIQSSLLRDNSFLETSLLKTAGYFSQCREKIKTLADFRQSETASIISLVFAAFVPLAGVATYLGMNTVEVANGNIPTTTFWKAAIPLTGAIYLIMWSAPILLQISIVAAFSGRLFTIRKWPLIIDLCVIVVIVVVAFTHIVYWRLGTDGYFVHYFNPISYEEPIIVNSILAVLEFLKCAEHVIQRNKRAKKWFGLFASMFVVDVFCAGLSTIDSTPATLVTPICYTIAVSLIIRPLLF